MKTIAVKIAGIESEPLIIVLHPGVTAWLILDTPDQEEATNPQDNADDLDDDAPDWVYQCLSPS